DVCSSDLNHQIDERLNIAEWVDKFNGFPEDVVAKQIDSKPGTGNDDQLLHCWNVVTNSPVFSRMTRLKCSPFVPWGVSKRRSKTSRASACLFARSAFFNFVGRRVVIPDSEKDKTST